MRRAVTLLELIIGIVIMGIALVMVGTGISAIIAKGKMDSTTSSVVASSLVLDNIFQRALRGKNDEFSISNGGHTVNITIVYEGRRRQAQFRFDPKEGKLYYKYDTASSNPERVVARDLKDVFFSRVPTSNCLGIDVTTPDGQRLFTSVRGRLSANARQVVD